MNKYSFTVTFELTEDWASTEKLIVSIVGGDLIWDGGGTDFVNRDVEFFCDTMEPMQEAIARLENALDFDFSWHIGEFFESEEFEDGIDWRELDRGVVTV